MAKDIKIKVCGMRAAENMREIAALRPDFFGLIFYRKSPRWVDSENLKSLPHFENIRRVGVFVNENFAQVLQTARAAKLTHLQLHGTETPEFCARLKNENLQIVKVFAVDAEFDNRVLKNYESVCDYFLFDTKTEKHGGSGEKFDWRVLRRAEINKPFFLSGGIGAENAAEAIAACENLPLFALDVNSRAETAPGVKSQEKIQQIIEVL